MSAVVVSLEEATAMVMSAAYDTGKDCPHCDGEGTIPSGELSVYTRRGPFGADNALDSVLEEMASATGPLEIRQSLFGKLLWVPLPRGSGARTLAVGLS